MSDFPDYDNYYKSVSQTGKDRLGMRAGKTLSVETLEAETIYLDGVEITGSGGGVTDGDKGDIIVSGSGATWTIDSSIVPPGYLLVRADQAFTLTNTTSTQPIFTSANDALTVVTGMTYRFRTAVRMTTGATSATVQFIFGGTATFTTLNAIALGIHAASGSGASPTMNNMESNTLTTVVSGGTGVNKRFTIEGEFEINAGGTIIPSIAFLADPTGTLTTNVGSFFEAWRVGMNPVTTIGPWA